MKLILASLLSAFAAISIASANCSSCAAGATATHASGEACSDAVLAHYLGIQDALANDNLEGAQAEAKLLLASSEGKACPIEDKDACAAIKEASAGIAGAGSIKKARAAFNGLSNALIAQIEKKGSAASKVYVMACPMANDHKGGQWLQASTDLKNPYFGASMLKCGMMQASIREEASAGCCAAEGSAAAGSCASCAAEKS